MVAWLGPAISAGASLLGGLFGQKQQDKNVALQREFAQSGIQWRVADAKKAGIHPLYAMGAPTVQPSVSAFSPMGAAVSSMGQDISRAMTASASEGTRQVNNTLQQLTLERAGLQNELLRSQIASMNARTSQGGQRGPSINVTDETSPFFVPQGAKEARSPLMLDNERVKTDPGTSPAKAWEDTLGDDVFSPGFLPNLFGMLKQQYGPPTTWSSQVAWGIWNRLSGEVKEEFGNFEQFLRTLGGGNRRNTGGR